MDVEEFLAAACYLFLEVFNDYVVFTQIFPASRGPAFIKLLYLLLKLSIGSFQRQHLTAKNIHDYIHGQ